MNSNAYETRVRNGNVWLPLTHQELRDSMERNGMRHSEITLLVEDVDAGHVLTADNGRTYRLAQCTPSADKCPVHGYASCPIENLPSDELDAVAAALNGATLPELDDDVIAAERAAQQQHDDELDAPKHHSTSQQPVDVTTMKRWTAQCSDCDWTDAGSQAELFHARQYHEQQMSELVAAYWSER